MNLNNKQLNATINHIMQYDLHEVIQIAEQITSPDKRGGWKPAVSLTWQDPNDSNVIKQRANAIAEKIWSSKKDWWAAAVGQTDNEQQTVLAITSIKSFKEFEAVQKAFKQISGGRYIATYINEFFGSYDPTYMDALKAAYFAQKSNHVTWAVRIALEAYTNRKHQYTVKRLDRIIEHLQKIAWPSTIKILKETRNKINQIAIMEDLVYQTSYIKPAIDFWNENKHEILLVAQLAAAIFLPYGLLIAGGIGLYDAYLYNQEGNTYQSGVAALFAIMPGIFKIGGAVLSKIPQLSAAGMKLTAKGWRLLGQKIAQMGVKNAPVMFNATERAVLKSMIASKNFLKPALSSVAQIQARRQSLKILLKASKSLGRAAKPTGAQILNTLSKQDRVMLAFGLGIIDITRFTAGFAAYGVAANVVTSETWDQYYDKTIGVNKQTKKQLEQKIENMYYEEFGMEANNDLPYVNLPR